MGIWRFDGALEEQSKEMVDIFGTMRHHLTNNDYAISFEIELTADGRCGLLPQIVTPTPFSESHPFSSQQIPTLIKVIRFHVHALNSRFIYG